MVGAQMEKRHVAGPAGREEGKAMEIELHGAIAQVS
jgi:hypothetical protein